MPDFYTVECEACGKEGVRRHGFPCPQEWFYVEATDWDTVRNLPSAIIYVYACSSECQRKLWNAGPGPKSKYIDPPPV